MPIWCRILPCASGPLLWFSGDGVTADRPSMASAEPVSGAEIDRPGGCPWWRDGEHSHCWNVTANWSDHDVSSLITAADVAGP